ncbi:MAG: hypothetical protein ACR2PT_06535 [Endozoicomonas sp.]
MKTIYKTITTIALALGCTLAFGQENGAASLLDKQSKSEFNPVCSYQVVIYKTDGDTGKRQVDQSSLATTVHRNHIQFDILTRPSRSLAGINDLTPENMDQYQAQTDQHAESLENDTEFPYTDLQRVYINALYKHIIRPESVKKVYDAQTAEYMHRGLDNSDSYADFEIIEKCAQIKGLSN